MDTPLVLAISLVIYYTSSYLSDMVVLIVAMAQEGNAKGGSITVPMISCLTGLESTVTEKICN